MQTNLTTSISWELHPDSTVIHSVWELHAESTDVLSVCELQPDSTYALSVSSFSMIRWDRATLRARLDFMFFGRSAFQVFSSNQQVLQYLRLNMEGPIHLNRDCPDHLNIGQLFRYVCTCGYFLKPISILNITKNQHFSNKHCIFD